MCLLLLTGQRRRAEPAAPGAGVGDGAGRLRLQQQGPLEPVFPEQGPLEVLLERGVWMVGGTDGRRVFR